MQILSRLGLEVTYILQLLTLTFIFLNYNFYIQRYAIQAYEAS